MNKAIKYRIYPNAQQIVLIAKTFGCCRKIWNLMLADKINHYRANKTQLRTTPAQYKKIETFAYLKEVDSCALANVQLQLERAIRSFSRHKHIAFPKFKSLKTSRRAYTTNNQKGTVAISPHAVKLPKLGWIRAKIHRQAPPHWDLKTATLSQNRDGKYYVSLMFEYHENIPDIPKSHCAIGLDYCSNGLYAASDGTICGSPKYYRKAEKKLQKMQRQMARKEPQSHNHEKARRKIARLHRHIANQRMDFLHKKAFEIANQYDVVCVESLNMQDLANQKFGNGKATLDNGYGLFLQMLAYKLRDRGKYLMKINKWYPSSQICNACGQKHPEMKDLDRRVFRCNCGYIRQRDINAAMNIRDEGLKRLGVKF